MNQQEEEVDPVQHAAQTAPLPQRTLLCPQLTPLCPQTAVLDTTPEETASQHCTTLQLPVLPVLLRSLLSETTVTLLCLPVLHLA